MATLLLAACLANVLTVLLHSRGATRSACVTLPSAPAALTLVYFLVRRDIEIGPHGGIVPAWIPAAALYAVVLIASWMTARLLARTKL